MVEDRPQLPVNPDGTIEPLYGGKFSTFRRAQVPQQRPEIWIIRPNFDITNGHQEIDQSRIEEIARGVRRAGGKELADALEFGRPHIRVISFVRQIPETFS